MTRIPVNNSIPEDRTMPPFMPMDHKTVLITGANSGVGYAAARELAGAGADIVMVCRDRKRGMAAQQELTKVTTGLALTSLRTKCGGRELRRHESAAFGPKHQPEVADACCSNDEASGGIF